MPKQRGASCTVSDDLLNYRWCCLVKFLLILFQDFEKRRKKNEWQEITKKNDLFEKFYKVCISNF